MQCINIVSGMLLYKCQVKETKYLTFYNFKYMYNTAHQAIVKLCKNAYDLLISKKKTNFTYQSVWQKCCLKEHGKRIYSTIISKAKNNKMLIILRMVKMSLTLVFCSNHLKKTGNNEREKTPQKALSMITRNLAVTL